MVVKQFEIWAIELDRTKGSEIKKSRHCLIVSPDVVIKNLDTVSVIPLTSTIKSYPTRVNCVFSNKPGQLMIDQMRSLDKIRFKKKLGVLDKEYCKLVCDLLVEMYRWRD